MFDIDLRPKLGRLSGRHPHDRFLFVCFYDPAGIATIFENIALWQKYSRYALEVLNLWPLRSAFLQIPSDIDLNEYAGIIIHCTVSYNPENLASLDADFRKPLENYDGVKVLMKQDEHFRANRFAQYVGDKAFDLVITCVSPEERDKVYPRSIVGRAKFMQAFTGYVSPHLRDMSAPRLVDRPLDITYRGSIQPLSFGRLGFEKRQIGNDVIRATSHHPIRTDISSRPADRITGTAWFEFLASSRAVLGVESATNLFDFTGEVEIWCDNFIQNNPGADHLSEEFYAEAHRLHLHKFEGNVNYAQISPRHFEAAAARAAQVLYDGYYSGVFVPGRHFIELKRDLSNFEDVLDHLADHRLLEEITERAFEEVVLNPAFQYETFVNNCDNEIEAILVEKRPASLSTQRARQLTPKRRALVLAAHEPSADPRIEWMAQGLASKFEVCELGTHFDLNGETAPTFEKVSEGRTQVRVCRRRHDWDILRGAVAASEEQPAILHQLALFHIYAELPPTLLRRAVGALSVTEHDLFRFRWACLHFLHTNSALIQAGRLIGEFDVIVAADLETLPAAIALGREYGSIIVYDAHEFWPYADVDFQHWEIEFWSTIERELLGATDIRVTVSTPLAACMEREYGYSFMSVPNCVSKKSLNDFNLSAPICDTKDTKGDDRLTFIFLGGFSPGRGIEDLIKGWRGVHPHARLVLQGPDGQFRSEMITLAESLGLTKGGAITFPAAVDTRDLVLAARTADVGVIPYAPSSINNRYCCPNKLSQYMAAGLPIVCNDTEFVKEVVLSNKLGYCVDFSDHQAFADTINSISANEQLRDMSKRSKAYFDKTFHWENVSGSLYAKIWDEVSKSIDQERTPLDYTWTGHGIEMCVLGEKLEGGSSVFSIGRFEAERKSYSDEIARLNSYVIDENRIYSAEIHRLSDEIARLNSYINDQARIYSTEIDRLNKYVMEQSGIIQEQNETRMKENATYTKEYNRLNDYILEQNATYAKEYNRLNEYIIDENRTYSNEISRLNRHIEEQSKSQLLEITRLRKYIDERRYTSATISFKMSKCRRAVNFYLKDAPRLWVRKLAGSNPARRAGRILISVMPTAWGLRLKKQLVSMSTRFEIQ
jgi:glycosyltransferase involved in cell wall biosynthesis